ncbi:MAG: DNA polymerase/3'-5' exonuclease PolX [Phycisphaerae bacterium]
MLSTELARAFARIADLLEIDGAAGYRINAYRRAARTLKDTTEDVAALAAADRLTDLPGIGKGTSDRIKQFLATGHIDVLTELEARLPPGLPDLLDIPSLGPKKVATAYKQLGVGGMEDLKAVIASGALAGLSGFGPGSVKKIADGIAFLESSGGRVPLGVALPIAEALAARVRALPGVRRVEIAGSLRRGRDTIGDVDLLCVAEDAPAAVSAFVAFDDVKRVIASGRTKGSVTVALDDRRELQIDLRAVDDAAFGAAMQYFTGSKAHNVRLRELAIRKRWRLNEYGLLDGERRVAGRAEADIYAKLGLPFIPPELREDRGEFDRTPGDLDLITENDIRGDLHMHTTASDGKCSIEDMAHAANARGYEYIAICDHSPSSTIANGLSIERMKRHIAAIRRADDRMSGITILVGTECDILPDGSLDYPDDILAQCDWVVASIHAAMGPGGSGKLTPTERTLAAIANRYVSVIGHPTGRLINRRAAMDLDIAAIATAAAANGTFLEINANWHRLDLKDVHIQHARAAGVTLSINTDAHSTEGLNLMRYGVATARRGGVAKDDVVNCLTLAALRKRIARQRGT